MARMLEMAIELWGFVRLRRKYWLAPMILIVFLLGFLLIFGQSSVAPFIYSLW